MWVMYLLHFTGESLPYIIPDGYNATLGQDVVEFRCIVPGEIPPDDIFWLINGSSQGAIGEEILKERGITIRDILVTDDDVVYEVITVEARAENDNSIIKCVAIVLFAASVPNEGILLRIQGDHKRTCDTVCAYMYICVKIVISLINKAINICHIIMCVCQVS